MPHLRSKPQRRPKPNQPSLPSKTFPWLFWLMPSLFLLMAYCYNDQFALIPDNENANDESSSIKISNEKASEEQLTKLSFPEQHPQFKDTKTKSWLRRAFKTDLLQTLPAELLSKLARDVRVFFYSAEDLEKATTLPLSLRQQLPLSPTLTLPPYQTQPTRLLMNADMLSNGSVSIQPHQLLFAQAFKQAITLDHEQSMMKLEAKFMKAIGKLYERLDFLANYDASTSANNCLSKLFKANTLPYKSEWVRATQKAIANYQAFIWFIDLPTNTYNGLIKDNTIYSIDGKTIYKHGKAFATPYRIDCETIDSIDIEIVRETKHPSDATRTVLFYRPASADPLHALLHDLHAFRDNYSPEFITRDEQKAGQTNSPIAHHIINFITHLMYTPGPILQLLAPELCVLLGDMLDLNPAQAFCYAPHPEQVAEARQQLTAPAPAPSA